MLKLVLNVRPDGAGFHVGKYPTGHKTQILQFHLRDSLDLESLLGGNRWTHYRSFTTQPNRHRSIPTRLRPYTMKTAVMLVMPNKYTILHTTPIPHAMPEAYPKSKSWVQIAIITRTLDNPKISPEPHSHGHVFQRGFPRRSFMLISVPW